MEDAPDDVYRLLWEQPWTSKVDQETCRELVAEWDAPSPPLFWDGGMHYSSLTLVDLLASHPRRDDLTFLDRWVKRAMASGLTDG